MVFKGWVGNVCLGENFLKKLCDIENNTKFWNIFRKKYAKLILSCLFYWFKHFDIKIISFRFKIRKLWIFKVWVFPLTLFLYMFPYFQTNKQLRERERENTQQYPIVFSLNIVFVLFIIQTPKTVIVFVKSATKYPQKQLNFWKCQHY